LRNRINSDGIRDWREDGKADTPREARKQGVWEREKINSARITPEGKKGCPFRVK
jgi:hypothetical protein